MKDRLLIVLVSLAFAITAEAHEYFFRSLPIDYNNNFQQINLLFQSRDKIMWLGTDNGLYSFDGRKYTYFKNNQEEKEIVSTVAESPDGQIWAGYENGAVLVTDFQGRKRQLRFDSLQDVKISRIVFSKNNTAFIATYGKGLWEYKDNNIRRIVYDALATMDDIYDALLVNDEELWLGTDNGILIYTISGHTLKHIGHEHGLKDEIVTKLAMGNAGQVLISMFDHGAASVTIADLTVKMIKEFTPLEGSIRSLVHGYGSENWVATDKKIWFSSSFVESYEITFPFELQSGISSLHFDLSGNLWLATGKRLYIANTQVQYIHPPISNIQCVLSTGAHLWIGTLHGLFRTNRDGQHAKSFLRSENINVISLYRDSSGLLWVGTFGQGLYIIDPVTNRSRHLGEKDFLTNTSILNIDGKGRQVWLATLGGITEINWKTSPFETGLKVSDLQDEEHTPPGYIYDVYVSLSGKVWFGTDGKGLVYLENNVLHSLPVTLKDDKGKRSDLKTIYSITEDQYGLLWISTVNGLVISIDSEGIVHDQFTSPNGAPSTLALTGKKEILMIRDGNITVLHPDEQLFWLDESNGLASFVPNINATSVDRDGSVWIADSDAIFHYFSYNPLYDRQVEVQFEGVRPGSLSFVNPVRIRPDSNFLDIRFTGISFQNPVNVRYRYMLDGHDPDWIHTQEGRAVYSRLSPGEFTFKVQASLNDDFSKAQTLEQRIEVLPPFYQRWWFIVSLLALGTYIVYSLYRARIARLQRLHELEKEKTTLQLNAIQAQVNPHFLFNSFNTLSSIIEEDQEAAIDYVD